MPVRPMSNSISTFWSASSACGQRMATRRTKRGCPARPPRCRSRYRVKPIVSRVWRPQAAEAEHDADQADPQGEGGRGDDPLREHDAEWAQLEHHAGNLLRSSLRLGLQAPRGAIGVPSPMVPALRLVESIFS